MVQRWCRGGAEVQSEVRGTEAQRCKGCSAEQVQNRWLGEV